MSDHTLALMMLVLLLALGLLLAITRSLRRLAKQGERIMAHLDALIAQVEASTTVAASAVKLIEGLAKQLHDAKDDPAEVQALVDKLRASSAALGAALTANTPAEVPPAVTP